MRNLNFRVWDKNENLMVSIAAAGRINFTDRVIEYVNTKNWSIPEVSFDDCEIMQSTGIKDYKGAMIFEGDILQIITDYDEEHILPVYWNEEATALMIKLNFEDFDVINFGWAPDWVNTITIIGNIYENPELLEKKE